MLALRRDDVADLNQRAHALMTAAGRLGGEPLVVSGRPFAVGDEVVCLRNDARHEVLNGTRGTVLAVDLERRQLTLRTGDGEDRLLTAEYLDSSTRRGGPALDHAYAITGHKTQGMTTGQTFVLGSDALYREWGYVAMSRGRDANHLYVVTSRAHDRDEYAPARKDRPDRLIDDLARSQAQPLAHDTDREAELADMPLDDLRRLAEPPRQALASSRASARIERELERAEDAVRRLEVQATGHDGEASPPASAPVEHARERRDRLQAALADARVRSDHGQVAATAVDTPRAREELVRREALAVRRALATPAPYLETALGVRPKPPVARRTWERAATDLERYRFRHDVRSRDDALGPKLEDLRAGADWRDARRRLDRARAELSRDHARDPARDLGREVG